MLFLAYIGGILTILSPCILPIVPLVFSRADRSFARETLPMLIGLAAIFALVASVATASAQWIVKASEIGRYGAIALLAVVSVGLSCAMVYVMAQIIVALAPQFGAKAEFGQAFKVAAYFPTAGLVGTLAMVIPALWFVALIGWLYSLYLLFVGLPKLMKPAADKSLIFTLAVIGCTIVFGIVASFIIRAVI